MPTLLIKIIDNRITMQWNYCLVQKSSNPTYRENCSRSWEKSQAISKTKKHYFSAIPTSITWFSLRKIGKMWLISKIISLIENLLEATLDKISSIRNKSYKKHNIMCAVYYVFQEPCHSIRGLRKIICSRISTSITWCVLRLSFRISVRFHKTFEAATLQQLLEKKWFVPQIGERFTLQPNDQSIQECLISVHIANLLSENYLHPCCNFCCLVIPVEILRNVIRRILFLFRKSVETTSRPKFIKSRKLSVCTKI